MGTITIFDNYDLDEEYDDMRELLLENFEEEEEVTDDFIWNEIYENSRLGFGDVMYELKKLFNNSYVIFVGGLGLWNGTYSGGKIGNNFEKLFYDATKDCDYIKIWSEDGHLFLKCSHHDGTNSFEIKKLNNKGYKIFDNWNYNYSNTKTEEEMHTMLFKSNFYTSLPHYERIGR